MKKLATSLLMITMLVIGNVQSIKVANAGVPVLSPTELVQAVLQYTQILKDYEEQLTMVQQGYEEYDQMQKDYLLALNEWDHLLEQCQAYKDLWGNYNWDKFLNEMSDYFLTKNAYSHNQILSLYNDENYRNSRTLLMTKNGKVYTYQDAVALLDSLKVGNNTDLYEDMRIKENQVNSGVNRVSYTSMQQERITDTIDRLGKIEDEFDSLGDNSQLATMQYQAKLQSESLNLQVHQLEMLNELISQQNQAYDQQSVNLHKSQTAAYEKAKKALNTKIIINNSNSKINF